MKVKTENKKKLTLVAPPLNHAVCLDRNRIKEFALIQVVLLPNLYFTGMRQNIIYSMSVCTCWPRFVYDVASITFSFAFRLLEKKTSPTVASIAEAASGVCLQADNAEEIQSAEAAAAALAAATAEAAAAAAEAAATAAQVTAEAVVIKEEPPTSDEMESESPTQPLDQLNEALIVEGQEKDTERYIVKATPMTASSSSRYHSYIT